MKFLKCFSFIFCLAALSMGFSSCGDDDDEGGEDLSLGTAPYEGISGKYSVTTASSRYQSIELGASGSYIIELNRISTLRSVAVNEPAKRSSFLRNLSRPVSTRGVNDDIIYGTYTKEGNILHLKDFGTLEILYDGNTIAGFKLTPAGESTVSLEVEKEAQMEDDALNNQLCRTWNIISIHDMEYMNGRKTYDVIMTPDHPYAPNDDDVMEELEEFPIQVMFSKAGTYLVYFSNHTLEIANWAWRNKAERTINYGWGENWQESEEWFTAKFSGKRMTVVEDYTDEYNGVTERYYSETILEAAN